VLGAGRQVGGARALAVELDLQPQVVGRVGVAQRGGVLGRLFTGDLRAEYDEYEDPNVLFAGRKLVAEVAVALDGLDKDYFARIFRSRAQNEGEAWLYEPLQRFFSTARQNGSAVVLMWEN
jgi:hypothetical protein